LPAKWTTSPTTIFLEPILTVRLVSTALCNLVTFSLHFNDVSFTWYMSLLVGGTPSSNQQSFVLALVYYSSVVAHGPWNVRAAGS